MNGTLLIVSAAVGVFRTSFWASKLDRKQDQHMNAPRTEERVKLLNGWRVTVIVLERANLVRPSELA